MGVETMLLLLSGSVAAVALISAVAIRGWMGSHKAIASTAIAIPQTASYYEPAPVAENTAVETSASTQPPEAQAIALTSTTSFTNEDYKATTTEVQSFEDKPQHYQEAPQASSEIVEYQAEVSAISQETTTTYPTASEAVESAATPNNNEVVTSKPTRRTSRSRANGTRRQRRKAVQNGA